MHHLYRSNYVPEPSERILARHRAFNRACAVVAVACLAGLVWLR